MIQKCLVKPGRGEEKTVGTGGKLEVGPLNTVPSLAPN